MAKNSVIKLITDNYDLAKEWYYSLMNDEKIPGYGKIKGLPEEHEKRNDMAALIIISSLECMRTGNAEVQLPTEETVEALALFESLMDANLHQ